jgi:hypothetical protein
MKGQKPTVRRLRLTAVGCDRMLEHAGYLTTHARAKVAEAFSSTPGAIYKWEQKEGKLTDAESAMIKALPISRYKMAKPPWTTEKLLAMVKAFGAQFSKKAGFEKASEK